MARYAAEGIGWTDGPMTRKRGCVMSLTRLVINGAMVLAVAVVPVAASAGQQQGLPEAPITTRPVRHPLGAEPCYGRIAMGSCRPGPAITLHIGVKRTPKRDVIRPSVTVRRAQ